MTERGLLVAAIAAAATACGTGGERPASGAGKTAAAALAAALDQAATTAEPWRCARAVPAAGPSIAVGARTWERAGAQLTSAAGTLTIAAVADARGAVDPGLHDALRAARPDLVIAVGGMGGDQRALESTLGAIVDPGWLTIAVPGTTEPWPTHRAAVAALAAGGAAIVDGSDVRVIDAGAAVIATLPGLPYAARLAAGAEGCGHDAADVARIVTELTRVAGQRPTVLAGPRAPQGGDDRTPGGVRAGDPELAAATTGLALVIHAPLDGAPVTSGQADGADHDAIAAGSLDPAPRYRPDGGRLAPTITVVGFDRRGRAWRASPVGAMVR